MKYNTRSINVRLPGMFKEWNEPARGCRETKLLQPGRRHEKYTNSHVGAPGCGGSRYFIGRLLSTRRLPLTRSLNASEKTCSEAPVHSFRPLGWGSWLMTWQRSSMQIASICHGASSTPYIYLLILLNISAYYWLFVGGGQWCMFLHDAVQKKAISRSPHIYSCRYF